MAGDTIRFQGHVSDLALSDLYARARAFLFAAEEDFGIALVEAQSYGLPVVAYEKGGAGETVVDPTIQPYEVSTGVLYREQMVEFLCAAIYNFIAIEPHFISPRNPAACTAKGFEHEHLCPVQ